MVSVTFSSNGGKEPEIGYAGSIRNETAFLLLSSTDIQAEEHVRQCLILLKDHFARPAESLEAFVSGIAECLETASVPKEISLSAISFGEVTYLRTLGDGQIYLTRGENCVKIIEADKSASGDVQLGDRIILTSLGFMTQVDPKILQKATSVSDIHLVSEKLTSLTDVDAMEYPLSLFLSIEKPTENETERIEKQPIPDSVEPPKTASVKKKFTLPFHLPSRPTVGLAHPEGKRRFITFGIVGVIVAILVWSVGFGYTRRQSAEVQKKLQISKEIITQKLSQASDVSFLNPARSTALIDEAQAELTKMKEVAGKNPNPLVTEMEKLLTSQGNSITKKEDKQAVEFFDLTIDNKSAKGTTMSKSGDSALIYDSGRNIVYELSLSKKSLVSYPAPSGSQAFVKNGGDILALTADGVYAIDASSKQKKVIDRDPEWGTIVGFTVFNGNVYMTDSSKDAIYKYIATDAGYSTKNSYFKGTIPSLKSVTSMAIDSSIYLSSGATVLKYTSGLKDSFDTTYPNQDVTITKVITDKDTDNVYAYDKTHGVVYVLTKSGEYQRQIQSSALLSGDDVVVQDNKAFVLSKDKIYTVALQ